MRRDRGGCSSSGLHIGLAGTDRRVIDAASSMPPAVTLDGLIDSTV